MKFSINKAGDELKTRKKIKKNPAAREHSGTLQFPKGY